MQVITIEIDAQRAGRASGYLGGLTVERYAFTGADLPAGTRLAILTRAGGIIAASTIAEGNAAEVDTNTQEVADLLRFQPLGACESVYITLGDADNILAIIPATMRKNWLDDEAAHPPVPANRYPTKTELDQWLARFDERAAQTAAAQSAAQSAASAASGSATEAKNAATAASNSSAHAADSAKDAGDSAVHAEDCERAAEAAQGKAEAAQSAAESAAQNAASGVAELLQEKVDAAEAAQVAAQGAATSAGESAELAAERLALVPAIAVDAEAALEASRELLGTAPATLVELSAAL